MAEALNNYTDIIDSRDVIERIAQLNDIEERDADDEDELQALLELQEDVGHPGWVDGIVLIRDSYFKKYAQELADDLGIEVPSWPYCHIDWDAAAENLQAEYSSVDFDGETYWYSA